MASGGDEPPGGEKKKLSRDHPDFLFEQMIVSGMYAEYDDDER